MRIKVDHEFLAIVMEKPTIFINKKLDTFEDFEMVEEDKLDEEESHAISLTKIMKEEKYVLNRSDMRILFDNNFQGWESYILKKLDINVSND